MITRTRDVAWVNAMVGRDFPGCDFTEVLSEPLHWCLVDDETESGAFFMWRGPGIFECHVFFTERGKAADALIKKMVAIMRAEGARMLWAMIPMPSRHIRLWARRVGWKSQGVVETKNGPNEIFMLEFS